MKFTIVVVVLALAFSAQASVVPLSYAASPLGYAASPLAYSYAPSPLTYTAHSAPLAYASAVHLEPAHYIEPAHYAAPVHYAAHAIVPVAAEGTYTAVTRGAVHVAPLPGHSQSASSINLAPAPGTY